MVEFHILSVSADIIGVCVCVCVFACVCVCLRACVCVRSTLHSVRFGQLSRCAPKRIVISMKVCIERNNMQVQLIRFRKKDRLDVDVGNFEVDTFATDVFTHGNSFQHMPVR